MRKVCIVGASGKLGRYMVRHALARGYQVAGVCREGTIVFFGGFDSYIEDVDLGPIRPSCT